MRIDEIRIQNFKGFKDQSFRFHPQFNLVIGVNGSGKTALLDAASVVMGVFANDLIRSQDQRKEIELHDVRVAAVEVNNAWRFEPIFPSRVTAISDVFGNSYNLGREKSSERLGARIIDKALFEQIPKGIQAVEDGHWITYPLLAFYECARLWWESTNLLSATQAAQLQLSRRHAYHDCLYTSVNIEAFLNWIISQTIEHLATNPQSNGIKTNRVNELSIVNQAIKNCLEGAVEVRYDLAQKMVVVDFEGRGPVPFRNLSDGQRVLLAMVGDIARRATILNPHLGEKVLLETPGVVLVDELDLHLHPKWQRRVIEDLRRTFPKIQFICTTHSPFLIQSLRSPEELISLDEVEASSLDNRGIEEIAVEVMGVDDLEFSQRYKDMLEAAKAYLDDLDQADKTPKERLDAFKEQLANRIAPFADNPAFQAFLERKRIAKMGE